MVSIPCYLDLEEKRTLFRNGSESSFIINTVNDLNLLFANIRDLHSSKSVVDIIFRGVNNAKFKSYNSAQRHWNMYDLNERGINYYSFLDQLVEEMKRTPIVNHVFNRYNVTHQKRDFPILALLRHYGAPTPLLDWSYSLKSALFFAIDKYEYNRSDTIGDYISVYMMDMTMENEFYNSKDIFPNGIGLSGFSEWDDGGNKSNSCFYLSDFEPDGYSLNRSDYPYNNLFIQDGRKETTIFNQRIILQDGLLVFNPHKMKCLEEMFNTSIYENGANLDVSPFHCFNIHYSLISYIQEKVLAPDSISTEFIYPDISRIVTDFVIKYTK